MGERVLAAMSGGVDSSVAAALMVDQGYGCTGVTLWLCGKKDEAGLDDARRAACKLGIPHHVTDFRDTFADEVIRPFIGAYEQGLTPNPCIACNRYIKFGRLFSEAGRLGCGILVTGHYAQIEKSGSRYLLKKAADPEKDQSYVLYSINSGMLAHIRFPLGGLTKSKVKETAVARGLAEAGKPESQDICFVPDGGYGAFMEAYTGKRYPHGDILDPDGNVVGRHKGLVRYTLGQRRGLGVAANGPVYVSAKDPARNTVTLGPESALFARTLYADNLNLTACGDIGKPMRVQVKTRYRQQEQPAWAEQTGPDRIRVDFDAPQRAITPGQSAVLYDGAYVVGGGIITHAVP